MIYYDSQSECWTDDNDSTFKVDMTPEGGEPEEIFNTQEEFWAWYK